MSLSLRDQLLAAGLIDEKQVKQQKRQQHHERRQPQNKAAPKVDEKALAAQRAAEEKRLRDAEANRRVQDQIAQRARRAEIKQLVDQHKLPRLEGELVYNFVDGKKIRRIPVDAERRKGFINGSLAIVRSDGRYEVVPAAIGERVRERDPSAVMPLSSEADKPDENDPYKDYVVPDDLMW